MKMPRLRTNLEYLADAPFLTKSTVIQAGMTGNPFFPNPTPALPVLDAAIVSYATALTAAQSKGKDAVAVKKQARAELAGILIQLANSVITTANGNRTMLVSSGFDRASEGENTPIVKPSSIYVADGQNAGELVVKVPRIKGATGYVPQYTPDPLAPDSDWKAFMTSTSKYTFTNLQPAKKYWCRVAVVGPYNQMVFSDAVCRVAQ